MGSPPSAARFARGDVILHRTPSVAEIGARPPVICDVRPMVVVEDSEALASLWLPAGTPTKMAVPLVEETPRRWLPGEWQLVDGAWDRWNTLMFMVPGQWRATWVMWTPAWEFLGWYVNLEEPFRRTPLGFDVRDLQLDILVDPERKWRWKDEDELEGSVKRGLISEAVARRARAEGAAAIADIERGAWPFTDDMRDWRPDPTSPIPTLANTPAEEVVAIHDEPHWTNPNRL